MYMATTFGILAHFYGDFRVTPDVLSTLRPSNVDNTHSARICVQHSSEGCRFSVAVTRCG